MENMLIINVSRMLCASVPRPSPHSASVLVNKALYSCHNGSYTFLLEPRSLHFSTAAWVNEEGALCHCQIHFSLRCVCFPRSAVIVMEGEGGLDWNNNKSVPLNTLDNSGALAFAEVQRQALRSRELATFNWSWECLWGERHTERGRENTLEHHGHISAD